jgi:hypothetical protein
LGYRHFLHPDCCRQFPYRCWIRLAENVPVAANNRYREELNEKNNCDPRLCVGFWIPRSLFGVCLYSS